MPVDDLADVAEDTAIKKFTWYNHRQRRTQEDMMKFSDNVDRVNQPFSKTMPQEDLRLLQDEIKILVLSGLDENSLKVGELNGEHRRLNLSIL